MNSNKLDDHSRNLRNLRVALVYDRVNKWGGAERVLLSLKKIFPDAPLFTSLYSKETAKWADDFEVHSSFLQNIDFFKKRNEALATLMPIAFENFKFDEFDLVVSVTSEAAKGIITKPNTCHICYCLTPTRYLWSSYETYFENDLFRFISKPAVSYLRAWDKTASQRPDYIASISKEVQRRVRLYYGRESDLLYPPVSLRKYKKTKKGGYFLLVSRLSRVAPYKKIDLAIKAFSKTNFPLKIAGSGSGLSYFQSIAGKNIEFLGEVDDEHLSELYSGANALIFPSNEDFGLVVVESHMHGTPVIAFRGGGSLETIKEGINGEFFDNQSEESIIGVLKKFDYNRYNDGKIRKSAEKFSSERFMKEFKKYIEEKTTEYFFNL